MRLFTSITLLILLVSTSSSGADIAAGVRPEGGSAASSRVIVVRRDPSKPGGLAFVRSRLTPAESQKAKADPGVVTVLPDKPIEVPPVPGPHMDWSDMGRSGIGPFAWDRPQPTTWFAKQVHGATTAWASGYKGTGVKVAIIDEGIDFGHPDLEGTQARVTDPSSPYYGWPIAFDPGAMAAYASKGTTTGGYANTSYTVTGPTAVYRGRTYTLTGTSKSGVYHIGPHPSYWLPFIVDPWGRQPSVLVVDEHIPGVYDTVYVDINKNLDFRDDKPCRKGDEAAWWDADGDGLADYSAGMVYFIADGKNPIPASDWLYHLPPPPNGSLVAFAGGFGKYESHGTLVASAVVAQGKVGKTYELPQKPAGSGGMVYGMAPEAKIIQIGNVYASTANLYDAILFAVTGYDGKPGTGDEADIANMSFGISSEDADGWDFLSRYITYLNETIAPNTTFVASSGNGGPGYGTVASPGGAASAVTVGAVTLYGSTDAFASIGSPDQILYGDIQQWSDRGPSSLGQVKPEVSAIGAWATGDVPVYGSGEYAWGTWGGTSLSAPITSGILALIYEAYREHHGVFPTYQEAKTILMAGAKDLCYNVFEQGAGMVDAARSTDIASGSAGFVVTPSSWSAGGSNGPDAPAFPRVLKAGQSAVAKFSVENTGKTPLSISLTGRRLLRTGTGSFDVDTNTLAEDPEASSDRPDYLVDLTNIVPDDVDLLRMRVSVPYDQFSSVDPTSRFLKPENVWMVSMWDWKDLNGNGRAWTDLNANGAVNDGEMDEGEMNQFMIANPLSDVIEISVKRPKQRIHDGLLLGLHHGAKLLDSTSFHVRVDLEFYRETDWDWVSVPSKPVSVRPGGTADVRVKLQAPNDAVPGVYAGSVVARDGSGAEVIVPVSAVVTPQGSFPSPKPSIVRGTDGTGDTYDNGVLFGSFDWGWREESGDWRFYFVDVPPKRPDMTPYLLVNAKWPDMPADTDVLVYRPDWNDTFSTEMPGIFGPYGMVKSGASRRTFTAAGMWPFDTATGGPSEWVAGRADPGLNMVQLHNVLASGEGGAHPIDVQAGEVWMEPSQLELNPGQTQASLSFVSSMALPGLAGRAYGFSTPQTLTGIPIRQEPIDDPSSAQFKKDITVSHAGLLDVQVNSKDAIDVDLYLLYDSNADGYFDWTYEVAAMSAGSGPSEHIRYLLPKDGNYRIAVHGYRVPQQSTFDLSTLVVTGSDLTVTEPSAAIRHGQPQPVDVSFPPAPSGAAGIIFFGPPEAPQVIPLAVNVR